MTKPNQILTLLVLLVVVACNDVDYRGADETEADIEAITGLYEKWASALKSGDAQAYIENLTDDAVWMPPNEAALEGKVAIRDWLAALFEQIRVEEIVITHDEISVAGDLALDRASFNWTLVPLDGGEPFIAKGKYIIIWQRQVDGSWKASHDIWNSNEMSE